MAGDIKAAIDPDAASSDGALSATITRSCGPSAAASSLTAIRLVCEPDAASTRKPCSRTRASVAPRATADTSCPARTSRAAISPPTAPSPTMATFMAALLDSKP